MSERARIRRRRRLIRVCINAVLIVVYGFVAYHSVCRLLLTTPGGSAAGLSSRSVLAAKSPGTFTTTQKLASSDAAPGEDSDVAYEVNADVSGSAKAAGEAIGEDYAGSAGSASGQDAAGDFGQDTNGSSGSAANAYADSGDAAFSQGDHPADNGADSSQAVYTQEQDGSGGNDEYFAGSEKNNDYHSDQGSSQNSAQSNGSNTQTGDTSSSGSDYSSSGDSYSGASDQSSSGSEKNGEGYSYSSTQESKSNEGNSFSQTESSSKSETGTSEASSGSGNESANTGSKESEAQQESNENESVSKDDEEDKSETSSSSSIRADIKEVIDTYVEAQREYSTRYDNAPVSEKLRLYKTVIEAYRKYTRLPKAESLSAEEEQYYNEAQEKVDQMYQ